MLAKSLKFGALRHRNYRLFFFGQVISFIGTWMQITAQSWLVYELTHSSVWLGIIGFLNFLPFSLFALLGGSIADRRDKRLLIVTTQTLAMMLAFVYAILVYSNHLTVHGIGILAFSLGVISAFETPARQAFVVDLVGKEDLSNGIALNSAMFNAARLLGPALAGMMIAAFGVAWCLFANAFSFVAALAALLAIKTSTSSQQSTAAEPIWRSLREIFLYIRRTLPIFGLLALVSTTTIFGWSFSVVLPVFAEEVLGGGAVELGNLLSASGVGAFTGAIFVATQGSRFLPRKLLLAGLTLFVMAITIFALSRAAGLSRIALAFAGFGLIVFYVNSNSALQRRVPDHLRGRIMGIYVMCFAGLMPLGSLQIGLISQWLGAAPALLINAAICALATGLAFHLVKRLPKPSAQMPSPENVLLTAGVTNET